MEIERTCRITLSAEEVLEAITAYIREKYRYGANKVNSWEECLSFNTLSPTTVIVLWGEKPEEEVERDEPAGSGVTCSEAACKVVGTEHNPEPMALTQ